MSARPRHDFTENLEAVARGVRRLEEVRDPILREAVAAALRLQVRGLRLDPASRVRMRNTVLAALAPARPTLADHGYAFFAVLGKPAPVLVRGLVAAVVVAGVLGGATVASADSLPEDPLYAFKLAGEQLRLAIAVSPEDRATVEFSIAEHRLDEAERLATSGRDDDAIVATASYGSSLADAAADLASVEMDPSTSPLVAQLQATLAASQQRVALTTTRLAADPRTVNTALVLASVAATAAPSKDSAATKIADQAVAITAHLAVVADDRVRLADPRRDDPPRAAVAPHADAPSTPTTRVSAPPWAITTDPPDREATLSAARAAQTAPANPSTARQAAEKARQAAQKALEAAEKAKRAGSRHGVPDPARR